MSASSCWTTLRLGRVPAPPRRTVAVGLRRLGCRVGAPNGDVGAEVRLPDLCLAADLAEAELLGGGKGEVAFPPQAEVRRREAGAERFHRQLGSRGLEDGVWQQEQPRHAVERIDLLHVPGVGKVPGPDDRLWRAEPAASPPIEDVALTVEANAVVAGALVKVDGNAASLETSHAVVRIGVVEEDAGDAVALARCKRMGANGVGGIPDIGQRSSATAVMEVERMGRLPRGSRGIDCGGNRIVIEALVLSSVLGIGLHLGELLGAPGGPALEAPRLHHFLA